jgi:hypothetical protein
MAQSSPQLVDEDPLRRGSGGFALDLDFGFFEDSNSSPRDAQTTQTRAGCGGREQLVADRRREDSGPRSSFLGHFVGDPQAYRTPQELAEVSGPSAVLR